MVIHGLDADLIMLSIISEIPNIFLFRERTEYNIENINGEYIYLDISILQKSLIQEIKPTIYNGSDKYLLYDYLIICFFLGNDFIQKIPSIQIRYNGLSNLMNVYHKIQRDYNGYFTFTDENYMIKMSAVAVWINELSKYEDQWMSHILHIRKKQEYSCKTKQFENPIDHYPILHRETEHRIFKNPTDWKRSYMIYMLYNTHHSNPSMDDKYVQDSKDVVKTYIQSILWTYSYYKENEPPQWKWGNPYLFAPPIDMIRMYLNESTVSISKSFNKDIPYTATEQLDYVLPKQDKDHYLYPQKYKHCHLLKRYMWECIPMIPIM